MAITCISQPDNWSRAADTNVFNYKFSSDKYTQPNYRYYIELYMYDNSISYTSLGVFLLHPSADGTCEFNPSSIYQNYLSYDINLSATGLTEMFQTIKGFKVLCNDYYGTPPVKEGGGNFISAQVNTYNGAQQIIPYTYTPLTPSGNTTWVMSTTQTGRYLTDMTGFRVDNASLGFVYCLGSNTNGRPNKVRYTSYSYGYANNGTYGEQKPVIKIPQQSQPNPSTNRTMDDPDPIQIINRDTIYSAVTYETLPAFTSNYTYGYYIPVGPNHVFKTGGVLTGYTDTWVYYDVDIMYNTTVLNKIPMRYIKTNFSCKYGRWEIFFLNKHGGFDSFTFDKKNELSYDVNRTTYKQKLPSNYSTYSAGEKVLNVESVENITLRSGLLTQQESMLITEMVQSPVVFATTRYIYNGTTNIFGSPYIVVDTKVVYQQKVNDKEISMEITLRPANERVIQRN